MSIALEVKPGPAITRADFVDSHPPYSIALDGYVVGAPFLELTARGPYRNFNHHEAVDRSCTCATCEQARRAVLFGLYDLFSDHGGRRATLWENDCDQDVCLATFTLMNPDRAGEPMLRVITQIEDLLDASAGAFPMPHERELLGKVRWVFEPYTRARPRLLQMGGPDMRQVIADVHLRIEEFLVGKAFAAGLEGTFNRLGGGSGWVLAELDHPHAREKMIAAGIRAAVELTARVGERFVYSVWRRSEYVIGFPVREILRALNVAEGSPPDDLQGWGGADNIGGSPRRKGSGLSPAQVEAVVNGVVEGARPKSP